MANLEPCTLWVEEFHYVNKGSKFEKSKTNESGMKHVTVVWNQKPFEVTQMKKYNVFGCGLIPAKWRFFLVEPITIKWPCSWSMKFLQVAFLERYLLNQKKKKMEHLDKLISKLTTSTSNGKYQLPTRMSQCATRAQGLMLISIFETHFLQARFSQARLSYGLNSCIILYFILLSMVQVHVTYGRNWVSVVWRVWVGFFRTFCMSLDQACYQVGKGHW